MSVNVVLCENCELGNELRGGQYSAASLNEALLPQSELL